MFRPNNRHLQMPIISSISQLPEAYRERLDTSWAGTFYREFFIRIDEAPFAVLFSDKASRPNTAINRLVSLEYLKAGHGWSDEEMFDALRFTSRFGQISTGLRKCGRLSAWQMTLP